LRTSAQTKQSISLHGTCPTAARRRYAFLQFFKVLGLLPPFDPFEGSNPSELFLDFESFRKTPARTPCGKPSNTSSVELPSTLHTPTTAVSQQVIQVTKPETLLSLRTPCTAPVLNLHFCENENKSYPYLSFQRQTSEPFVNALLADNSTALLAGTLAQIEKQLKLIPLPFPLRFQTFNKKSFIHSIKAIA
jgi:hypothetical protein